MGKAIIILAVVIALGLLGNSMRPEPTGWVMSDDRASNFRTDSWRYTAAYAENGQDFRFEKIDLNSADMAQLLEVNGIGPVIAKSIIDYREHNGYFRTLAELQNISGIGPKSIGQWESVIEIVIVDTTNQKESIIE